MPIPLLRLTLASLLLLYAALPSAALSGSDPLWFHPEPTTAAERSVRLYMFWSNRCPHCLAAQPFVEDLALNYPWLQVESYEIYDHPENRERFQVMAEQIDSDASSVPTFMWCGREWVGWSSAETSGSWIENGLRACYAEAYGEAPPQAPLVAAVVAESASEPGSAPESAPGVRALLPGGIDAEQLSLPVLTVVMAGLDAFNPCAFFVLLMLLSLLVHARDRRLMLLVGGIYVAFSGLIYFLFMAAWLNAFRWMSGIQAVTVVAGSIAVIIGLVNVKDFFWFKRGVSLSLSEDSRARLLARMRRLLRGDNLPALLLGTVVLAVAANSYELLCTVGFPMVYTRVLTLHELDAPQYYLYLALYNLIYVVPLLLIVLVFVATLGARKLSETQGRALKLMSGLMMLGLGLLLLLAPQALSNPLVAAALLLLAASLTVWLVRRTR